MVLGNKKKVAEAVVLTDAALVELERIQHLIEYDQVDGFNRRMNDLSAKIKRLGEKHKVWPKFIYVHIVNANEVYEAALELHRDIQISSAQAILRNSMAKSQPPMEDDESSNASESAAKTPTQATFHDSVSLSDADVEYEPDDDEESESATSPSAPNLRLAGADDISRLAETSKHTVMSGSSLPAYSARLAMLSEGKFLRNSDISNERVLLSPALEESASQEVAGPLQVSPRGQGLVDPTHSSLDETGQSGIFIKAAYEERELDRPSLHD